MDTNALRRYPADVARAFARAPLEVAYALLLAAGFSRAVQIDDPDAFQVWWGLAIVLGVAVSAAWAGTLLQGLGTWSARRRWAVSVTGAALAVILDVAFLDMQREAEVWRAATLAVAALLAALAAPALGSAGEAARLRFRRVNGRLLLRGAGAALYAAALYAGLVLALAAVDNLFELELDERIYAHVFGWIAFAAWPWIVLGGLPRILRPLDEESETLALVHRLSAWLLLPLLALYYLILYAYAVRILVLGEMPRNLVSPLVTVAGVLAALALIAFDPVASSVGEPTPEHPVPGGASARRVLRLVPLLFVPLAVLGVYAVGVRVQQYGWTEFRYLRIAFLVALEALALGATIQVVRRRPFSLGLTTVVVAVVLALSVVGPWSAPAASLRSQRGRMIAALEATDVLPEGAVTVDSIPARRVPAETYDELASSTAYLVRHFGPGVVSPPLPERLVTHAADARDLPAVLGLERMTPTGIRVSRFGGLPAGSEVELAAASLLRIQLRGRGPGDPTAWFADSLTVAVRTSAGTLRAGLEPLARWMTGRGTETSRLEIPAERSSLPLTDARGDTVGDLVVFDLRLTPAEDGRPVTSLDGVAVLPARGDGS